MDQTAPFAEPEVPISADSSPIHRTKGDVRQRALVRAAFEVISERGLEGLDRKSVV